MISFLFVATHSLTVHSEDFVISHRVTDIQTQRYRIGDVACDY